MSKNKIIIASNKLTFVDIYSRFGTLIILIVAVIIATVLSDTFLSFNNISNILRQNAVVMIIAFGAQMVLISGEVDLSAGSVTAFAGVTATLIMKQTGNVMLSIMAGLISGCVFGFINGWVITFFGIPAFISTLATQFIGRGAILAITNAQPVTGLDKSFTILGQGYVWQVPIPIIITIVVALIYWLTMNRRRFGRYVYATGGNAEAAKASGINVISVKIKSFLFAGLMSGLAGVILMSRLNSGQPSGAEAYEFDAITAAIIGGTSMSGGIGKVSGTIIGAIFVGVLLNIMTQMDVSAYYQKIVKGAIIALAVIIDVQIRKAKKS